MAQICSESSNDSGTIQIKCQMGLSFPSGVVSFSELHIIEHYNNYYVYRLETTFSEFRLEELLVEKEVWV